MKRILIITISFILCAVIAFLACYFVIPDFNAWVKGTINSGINAPDINDDKDDDTAALAVSPYAVSGLNNRTAGRKTICYSTSEPEVDNVYQYCPWDGKTRKTFYKAFMAENYLRGTANGDNHFCGIDTYTFIEYFPTIEDGVYGEMYHALAAPMYIINRQYSYLPINIYVSYLDNGYYISEFFDTYNVLFEIDTVFDCSFLLYNLYKDGGYSIDNLPNYNLAPRFLAPDYPKSLVDNGVVTADNVQTYEFGHAKLDFSELFANGFCYSDFSTSAFDYQFFADARLGIPYAGLSEDGVLDLVVSVDQIPDFYFVMDTENANKIDHSTHEHAAPVSCFDVSENEITEYHAATSAELVAQLYNFVPNYYYHPCSSKCPTCGQCKNVDCVEEICKTKCDCGPAEENPAHACTSVCPTCGYCLNASCTGDNCIAKCLCNLNTDVFPKPCPNCGYICENLSDYLNHPCHSTTDPDDGDIENPNPDNPDIPDNSGNDNNGGNNGGNDGEDGEDGEDGIGKSFTIGWFSFKNLKNLFDPDFWDALFKGKVAIDWLGLICSILIAIVVIILVFALIFPVFGSLLWAGIKLVLKGALWLVCLPFKGIKALIDKIRGE